MSSASSWSLPLHTSDTENQRAFKGKGGEFGISRTETEATQFRPGGAKSTRPTSRVSGGGMQRTER